MSETAQNLTDSPPIATVLVIDDSAVARGLMTRWVEEDNDLNLVGSAVDGEKGIVKAEELKPDLIILDVEMPNMDGLTALPLIMKASPKSKIVMASTLTRRGGEVTIRALSMGAVDYVPKPQAGRLAGAEEFRQDLLAKLKLFSPYEIVSDEKEAGFVPSHVGRARIPVSKPPARGGKKFSPQASAPISRGGIRQHKRVPEIIAIGSSTGGPQALRDVVSALPEDLKMPIVIAQHMPPLFTEILAEHLTKAGKLPCKQASDGDRLQAGTIYIAPGDYHMTIRKDAAGFYVVLDQTPPVNFCRPAVDPLFQSVTEATKGVALGVILTGMGADGREGVRALRGAGGTILVQDEKTSIVWGMPGAVAEAGLADHILPLSEIGSGIARRAKGGM